MHVIGRYYRQIEPATYVHDSLINGPLKVESMILDFEIISAVEDLAIPIGSLFGAAQITRRNQARELAARASG
jgi:hypothetical protein